MRDKSVPKISAPIVEFQFFDLYPYFFVKGLWSMKEAAYSEAEKSQGYL